MKSCHVPPRPALPQAHPASPRPAPPRPAPPLIPPHPDPALTPTCPQSAHPDPGPAPGPPDPAPAPSPPTRLEHFVRLVKHQDLDGAQRQQPLADPVLELAVRADDDLAGRGFPAHGRRLRRRQRGGEKSRGPRRRRLSLAAIRFLQLLALLHMGPLFLPHPLPDHKAAVSSAAVRAHALLPPHPAPPWPAPSLAHSPPRPARTWSSMRARREAP